MKKIKNFIPAILLILILIYRNMTMNYSSNNAYLFIGIIVVTIRAIFFKVSLKQNLIYITLLSIIGIFFVYIYTYDNVNDLITINYGYIASIMNLMNILLMIWLIYKYNVLIGIIYLLNALLISVEIMPGVANYLEILAVLIYMIINIKNINNENTKEVNTDEVNITKTNIKNIKDNAEMKDEKND